MKIRIAKFNSSFLKSGLRIIKVFIRGRKDVHSNYECSPWGDDSQPIHNTDSVHAETASDESTVILGYIFKNKKAGLGEKRIFATDLNGGVMVDIYLKNDGTIEMAGVGDNLVRYIPLNNGLQNFKNDIQSELTKIQTAITSVGGVYTPSTLDVDISGAKIDNIKTS